MKHKPSFIVLFFSLVFQVLLSCADTEKKSNSNLAYLIEDTKILKAGSAMQYIGANAFHSFGGDCTDMNSWNIDIVREFVGNVKENPISGSAVLDANGIYLHSLQDIVTTNRINHKITILCAFGWDGTAETMFTGKRPTQTFWWNDYKLKLQQWASYFKDQPDVWIEIWNEPYNYNRTDGYTDDIWLSDMNELVAIVRTNNSNIVLVPCAEQGQDESVLINKGASFLSYKTNILFDIHAYEKWLLATDNTIENRLENLKQNKIPVLFGEIAPMNAGVLMNPQALLDKIYNRGLSVCGWVWKYDQNDTDALLTTLGQPNNNNNNNWGTLYKNVCLRVRNP